MGFFVVPWSKSRDFGSKPVDWLVFTGRMKRFACRSVSEGGSFAHLIQAGMASTAEPCRKCPEGCVRVAIPFLRDRCATLRYSILSTGITREGDQHVIFTAFHVQHRTLHRCRREKLFSIPPSAASSKVERSVHTTSVAFHRRVHKFDAHRERNF